MPSEDIGLEIMEAIRLLADHCGAAPINKLPGLWNAKLSNGYELWVNGHRSPFLTDGAVEVKPFYFYIEFNGWPFASFSPADGVIGAGSVANADSFLMALRAAVATPPAEG